MEIVSADRDQTSVPMGLGIYSISDVARYLHATPQLVRNWVLGRPSRASRTDSDQRTSPILLAPPRRIDGEAVLTFRDLIELRFVRLFRQHGVSMPVIKAAAQNAAVQLQSNHPFGLHKFSTDGKKLFADLKSTRIIEEESGRDVDEKRLVQELDLAQMVMGDIIQIWLKDVVYDENIIRQLWLLGPNGRAMLDPLRGFGQPLDSPTGVPLAPLYASIRAGDSIAAVADWYEVPEAAVEAAIEVYTRYNIPS
jgi:DNA-binding transcriptional MerR regulator/uncharacterized protein (DUF433 family)